MSFPTPGRTPASLPAALAEASGLARELISVLGRETEALTGIGTEIPAGLVEAKTNMAAAYAARWSVFTPCPEPPKPNRRGLKWQDWMPD